MKIEYDKEVDALYIKITDEKPDGVIEVEEGINIDVTANGNIVGIELIEAKKRISFKSFLTYEIDGDSIGALMAL
ncbi:MAG: DUF2283 domain-containing protein [Deltaproteobacteria bacterium]|nr:DUF2283 domain-containing protein [Deltaproteobacteria bacterium]